MINVDLKGTKMPALGFGTWQLNGEACDEAVRLALKVGYRHIDTAQIYGNEGEVGRAILESKVAREQIFLTTKIWTENASPSRLKKSFADSLQKLRTDYVDLLLLHWPVPTVPLADTLSELADLQKQGQIKQFGVSNFPVRLMKEAVEQLKMPIACNQVEYHVDLSQKSVLDYAKAHEIVVTAYSPLGRAKLTQDPHLIEIGKKYNKSGAQVALRWLIEQSGVAAIPKSTSEKNIRENFDIFDFNLDAEDTTKLNKLTGNNRLVNPDFAPEWDKAA